jgi:chromosome segregation and condensation protein ScpB
LHNATELRELLFFITDFQFDVKKFKDIIRLTDGYDIQDAINSAYSNYSIEDTAFIVRSNKERINTMNKLTKILDKANCHQAIFLW